MNYMDHYKKRMLCIMAVVLIFCTQLIKGSMQVQAAEYAAYMERSRDAGNDADYMEQLMWSQMETALLEGNHVEWHLDSEESGASTEVNEEVNAERDREVSAKTTGETNAIEAAAVVTAAPVPTPTPAWRIALEAEELDLLERCVMAEGGGESYECQKAIACVIINRVLSDKYADTVEGVITQPGQFSTWPDHIQRVTVSNEVRQAVREALTTAYLPESVLYFRANRYHSWANDYCSIDNTFFSTP